MLQGIWEIQGIQKVREIRGIVEVPKVHDFSEIPEIPDRRVFQPAGGQLGCENPSSNL